MNLRQLRTLSTILDRGSFAAAADHIGLSHAAVSVQMNQLEATLAAELFDLFNEYSRQGEQATLELAPSEVPELPDAVQDLKKLGYLR